MVTAVSVSWTDSNESDGRPATSSPAERRIDVNIIKTPSQRPAPGPLQFDLIRQAFGLVSIEYVLELTVAGTAPDFHRIPLTLIPAQR